MNARNIIRAIAIVLILLVAYPIPALSEEEQEFWVNIEEDEYVMRGIPWSFSAEEVADLEGGTINKGDVRVDKPELYKVQALRLTYLFEDEAMTARSFRLAKKRELYGSMFISLFIRYGVPLIVEPNGKTAYWVLEDVQIELWMTDYVYVIFRKRAAQDLPEDTMDILSEDPLSEDIAS